MSMGNDLLAILKEAREVREQDVARERDRADCPVCGAVLDVNNRGVKNCPMGHWRREAGVSDGYR